MSKLAPQDIARETARESDGKFGTQEHERPTRGLFEAETDYYRRVFEHSIASPALPDIPTVAEVINRTVEEFTRIQKDMAGKAV